jgi:hypothetical protein
MLASMRCVAFRAGLLLLAAAVLDTRHAHAEGAEPNATPAPAPATAASQAPPTPALTAAPLDTRAKCVAEHEQSQIARMRESLLTARAAALSCSQAECPALLRTDCVQWFAELDREVPSLVISVRTGANDVPAATVRIDGNAVPQALDGQPLELDPGPHRVEVLPAGQPALSRDVVLAAGEKARLLVFELPSNAPPAAPANMPVSAPRHTHRPVPTLTWVLSGTAVAALATGSIFGGLALSERNKLEQKPESGGCSPYCSDADVAGIHHRTLAADVLFSVAAASAVGAVISYFVRPEVPIATGQLQLDFGFAPGSASLGVRGSL